MIKRALRTLAVVLLVGAAVVIAAMFATIGLLTDFLTPNAIDVSKETA